MHYKQRLDAIVFLGEILRTRNAENWSAEITKAYQENQWFTPENQLKAFKGLGDMLTEENITKWMEKYQLPENNSSKKIGLIMAGNIPLVGLHDLVCCILAGHSVVVKMSSDDKILLPALLKLLEEKFPQINAMIEMVDKLTTYDAVVATGSNNTATHFEYYFKHVPLLIRKNKHSVAILNGEETEQDFLKLGDDLFSYFGLGCRNVSKLYVPKNFDYPLFYRSIECFTDIKNHNKYANNHTYHKAINLMNLVKIYDNDFLILNESTQVSTPVAVCHYEFYEDEKQLNELLERDARYIQCMVTSESNTFKVQNKELASRSFKFGQAQSPKPWDYADGVDTLAWLINL